MKHHTTSLLSALAAAAALTLQGCGGGNAGFEPAPPAPPTTSVSGIVLDGALQSAKVCLDLNDNRACDSSEPSTSSDSTGAYTLSDLDPAQAGQHALLAEVTAGTAIDADAGVVDKSFLLVAPAGKPAVISPFTTLLQSELDGGRTDNLRQAEENVLERMVGTAGDVGGLTPYSDYQPVTSDTSTQATKRAKMYGLGQLLSRAFASTRETSGLSGKAAVGALGMVATGSLQQVLSQVPGKLTVAQRDTLFAALGDSLVPTAAHLAAGTKAAAATVAAPIEGAWIRSVPNGAVTMTALYLFAGDGTFVYQVIDAGVPSTTSTLFDNGLGYRYGRYTLAGGTLTTTLIEAASATGPAEGTLGDVTITGDTLTAAGGVTMSRVTSATSPLVGGWVRPNGNDAPEYLVLLADGRYVHGSYYYANDPQTGAATFFETAKSAGVRIGSYAVSGSDASVVNFGATTVVFNGTLAIPSNPGVATIQPDGSLSMTGLRVVKLGTAAGAKAVTGFSEATRSRLWSGRFFSRSVTVAGATRLQYVYVRGVNDVLTFLQPPTGSDVTVACGSNPAQQGTPLPDFSAVLPADGKLKQFVVGTSTATSAGYAQRRLHIGQPGTGNFVTYTPIAKPSNTTARCAWPI